MFRCLMQWKSFEADRTRVFDILIQMIGSKIEDEADNEHMVYWLSNTSTLLFLLQRSFKTKLSQPTGFFGRMTQGFLSSPSNLEGTQEVEPKYSAILFKQQLTAYVEKIYRIIRDNLKKKLSPSLEYFIQPSSKRPDRHWDSILNCLKSSFRTLKDNYVHPVLVQKIFTQTFSYINVKIFNSFLLHQECCTFINGEFLQAGLGVIEIWCDQAILYAGPAWDELNHTRQAVEFLVLSVPQLHRICTLVNCDGNNATSSVSADVFF